MQLSGSSEAAKVVNISSNEEIAFVALYLSDSAEVLAFGVSLINYMYVTVLRTSMCFSIQREECKSVLPVFDLA